MRRTALLLLCALVGRSEHWTSLRMATSVFDPFEALQAPDLKQAAIVIATFVNNAAMRDQMLPRRPRSSSDKEETR